VNLTKFEEFLTSSYRNATNLQQYFENSKDTRQIANFTMQSQTTIVVTSCVCFTKVIMNNLLLGVNPF
jgi:hypothetical protein